MKRQLSAQSPSLTSTALKSTVVWNIFSRYFKSVLSFGHLRAIWSRDAGSSDWLCFSFPKRMRCCDWLLHTQKVARAAGTRVNPSSEATRCSSRIKTLVIDYFFHSRTQNVRVLLRFLLRILIQKTLESNFSSKRIFKGNIRLWDGI